MNQAAGTQNGDLGATTQASKAQVKEHLRAARDAAGDAVRGSAQQARGWARSQWSELQDRVEAEPYRAAAWALGIGFIAGVLLTALARGRR